MRPFTKMLFTPFFLRYRISPGHISVSTRMKTEGLRYLTMRRKDHQQSTGMVARTFTLSFSWSLARDIPFEVAAVKTISRSGNFTRRAFTRGMAEMTSPTDRAWIHMFPSPTGVDGSFKANLSDNRIVLLIKLAGKEKTSMSVHINW